jgi:penicillin G amidase
MKKPLYITVFWSLLLIGILLLFSIRLKIGGQTLPALGSFFSPMQGFWQNAEGEKFRDTELKHASLSGDVQVVFDERLVPHIFAQNDNDVAFAQGYVHAMHRLWQMDIAYRDVSGHLAEIIGPAALDRDIKSRREGFGWAAEKALAVYARDPDMLALFQAYTDGVNYWINNLKKKDYPIEFKLLGYEPTEWSLIKSVFVVKSMSKTLTMKNYDIANSNIRSSMGEEMFEFLFPEYMEGQSPVHPGPWDHVTVSEEQKGKNTLSTHNGGFYGLNQTEWPEDDPSSFASNNWAVSGEKMAEGYPVLCNDPHLNLTLPSVWFENHIVTPEYNCYGVSLMGTPSIIIGFNEYIAWGITNGGLDVVDWLEIEWEDDKKLSYRLDDEWVEANSRIEIIPVKGNVAHEEKVLYTHWGPVVYTATDDQTKDLAMKWSAHDAIWPDESGCFFKLMKAKNIGDYDNAIKHFPSLIQNIVFASSEGDIALRTQGYWPVRQMDGRFISDGSKSNTSWNEYIPFESIPATTNPDRGFVSSANQHVTDPSYPFLYNGFFEAFRGRILNRYLSEKNNMTIEDMQRIQLSNFSLKAEDGLPLMLAYLDKDSLDTVQKEVYRELKGWQYDYDASSSLAVFFEEWFNELRKLTFDELVLENGEIQRAPEKRRIIEILKELPDHIIFDRQDTDDKIEKVHDILLMSFRNVWSALELEDKPFAQLNWNLHQLPSIDHLGKISAFGRPTRVGGVPDALNAVSSTHGPSWRQIVQLTPEGPVALGVYPGGQSGNPGSRYYDDSVDTWSDGAYHNLFLYKRPEEIPAPLFTVKMKTS